MKKYEKETLINYNDGESNATVCTASEIEMRKYDRLVEAYPEEFKLVDETEYTKTYEVPKSRITVRRPRRLTQEQREQKRLLMEKINQNNN